MPAQPLFVQQIDAVKQYLHATIDGLFSPLVESAAAGSLGPDQAERKGVALFASVWSGAEEAKPALAVFAVIWCVANLGLAGYGAYTLRAQGAGSRRSKPLWRATKIPITRPCSTTSR